jgi:KaiC/GvpD/RAD55 family RecA-like ATPase
MEGMDNSMPLPAPYQVFETNQALLYRGAVSLLAGGPGSMKTITALNFVEKISVPTLYISNDSTKFTIITRVLAMLNQMDIADAKVMVEKDPQAASIILSHWKDVRFEFHSKPSIETIGMNGEAFRELYGEYPPLTVVDILMNLDHEGVSEQNYWRVMPELKAIAAEWNTALLAVHHTSESAKGNPCPPMSAIMGKANQLPELIITTAAGKYSVVKNRNGPSDPAGVKYFELEVFAEQSRMEDMPEPEKVFPGSRVYEIGVKSGSGSLFEE